MPPPHRTSQLRGKTTATETEVLEMEARLQSLRTAMSAERERRESARQRNPTGSVWRSARTDVRLDSTYTKQVLSGEKAPSPRTSSELGAGADAARPVQSLLSMRNNVAQPPSNGEAPFAKTRANFEWNPIASFADIDGKDNDYEDLLGPEGSAVDTLPPSSSAQISEGSFNEEESAASFAEALNAWRAGGANGATSTGSACGNQNAGARGGEGGGGGLLHGTFDEDESAASFAEALNSWRRGDSAMAAAPSRPSRFGAAPTAPAAGVEPTLADKVHAIKCELGLPMECSLGEAIAAANRAVGLDSIGSLSDQVGRLLRESGIKAVRGSAPTAAMAGADGSTSPTASPAAGQSESRPMSRNGAMATQTAPSKTFYERYLEQKKRDGIA